jgi:serine/threonine-protein kinase
LVVVERIPRHGALDDVAIAGLVRAARALIALQHPNVGRTRDVLSRSSEVLVVRELIEGVSWADLVAAARPPPLEIKLRVLIEVLSGLSVLHELRDAKRQPLGLFHGGLTPNCIFVAPNGSSQLVVPSRLSSARRGAHTDQAYLAPEVLIGDDQADLRADIYSVGVLLWEAMTGKRLFADVKPSTIVTQLLSNKVPPATAPPDAPWATVLVHVAARALSVDPQKRFVTASAMAMELRRAAGSKLALSTRIAGFVKGAFGEVLKARRAEFERALLSLREAPAEVAANSVSEIPIAIDEPSSGDLTNPSSSADEAPTQPGRAPPPGSDVPVPRPGPPPLPAALPAPPPAASPAVQAPAATAVAMSAPQQPALDARKTKTDVRTPIMPIVVPPPAAVRSIPPPKEYGAARTSRHRARPIMIFGVPMIVALVGVACWLAFRPAAHPGGAGATAVTPRNVSAIASPPPSPPPPVGKLAPDKLVPDKLAPDKLAPDKLAPDKLAPETTALTARIGENTHPSAPSESPRAASANSSAAPASIQNDAKPPVRAKRAYEPQGI